VQLHFLIPSVSEQVSAGNVELDLIFELPLHIEDVLHEGVYSIRELGPELDLVYDWDDKLLDDVFSGKDIVIMATSCCV
jgi:hypothetical protein